MTAPSHTTSMTFSYNRRISPPPEIRRHQSINTAIGLPLSRVAIRSNESDKEEGEISDDDTLTETGQVRTATRETSNTMEYRQGVYEHYSPPGAQSVPLANGKMSGRSAVNGDLRATDKEILAEEDVSLSRRTLSELPHMLTS